MKHILSIVFLVLIGFQLSAQVITTSAKQVYLGDKLVTIKVISKEGQNLVYAHVHENETAALEAGIAMIEKYGGKLVTLEHSTGGIKSRNITFKHNGTEYVVDPNRIYTPNEVVLASNIKIVKGKGKVDAQVIGAVKNLANQVWDEIKYKDIIIAIHNNKNTPAEYKRKWLFWTHHEPESFSIKSYIKSHDQSSDSNQSCSDIYINPTINNSEFYIVTQRPDFELLVRNKYTVVLQNANPVDDGSMSVFAARYQKRYFNAEAKMGRVTEQKEMLEILLNSLFD
jgi:hypothetical protein